MALHFVSSAILTSNDGIDFDEAAVDSAEVRKARAKAEQDGKKSLFQQLADRQAQKDEEYETNRKLLLGSSIGKVDEEDVEFLEAQAEAKELRRTVQIREEEKLLEGFRAAKSEAVIATVAPVQLLPEKPEKPALLEVPITFVKKKKRKIDGSEEKDKDKDKESVQGGTESICPLPSTTPAAGLLGIADYGSDTD